MFLVMASMYHTVICSRAITVLASAFCLRFGQCWTAILLHILQVVIVVTSDSNQDRTEKIKQIIGNKLVGVIVLCCVVMVTDYNSMTMPEVAVVVSPCICILLHNLITISRCELHHVPNNSWRGGEAAEDGRMAHVKTVLELLGIISLYAGQQDESLTRSYYGATGLACLWLVLGLNWFTSWYTTGVSRPKREKSEDETADSIVSRTTHPTALIKEIDARVDRVYTIGCFDIFHRGHKILFQRMRKIGKQVIVGVHDDSSIELLKKRVPVDDTETRMLNVKKHADIVFCVAGTDPSNYLKAAFLEGTSENCLFVRGEDMKQFPGRKLCETLMPVKFFPYTEGVSSTQLRKEMGR